MEYCGGYFLLSNQASNYSFYLQKFQLYGYKIDKLISVDEKIGGIVPNLYSLWRNKVEYKGDSLSFSEKITERVLVPNVFENLEDALAAYKEIRKQGHEAHVIAASLDKKYLSLFNETRAYDSDENEEGVIKCLSKEIPEQYGGIVIGYDVAGYELGGMFLSYLANDLLNEYIAYRPGLRINKYGLISQKEDAEELARYTNEVLIDEVGAEELHWFPWKITLYNER